MVEEKVTPTRSDAERKKMMADAITLPLAVQAMVGNAYGGGRVVRSSEYEPAQKKGPSPHKVKRRKIAKKSRQMNRRKR